MFILRRVTSEGFESNTVIGNDYGIVHSVFNEKEFIKNSEQLQYPNSEEIFAFIDYKGGSEIMPLYKKSNYYMMTETGQTFANLSLK